jgi:hypothetical protein
MRLDKVLLCERYSQLLAQLSDSGALVLSTSIRQQNERDTVVVQIFERGGRAGNRGRGSQKHSINAAGAKRSVSGSFGPLATDTHSKAKANLGIGSTATAVLLLRRWRVKGAMLKTVRGDCRNGGAEEEEAVDIEEKRMGWRPVAAAGLYCKAGLWFRASE